MSGINLLEPINTKPWYVVQLKPNAEAIAKRNLLRQNIEIYAPYEEITSKKAQKLTTIKKSLFPGYLFVSFDHTLVRWGTVNSTMGVNRMISFTENRPAQVPQALIDNLMKRCDRDGKLLPPQNLHSGDMVHVTTGPFAEFIGTVEQIAADQRIWVLMDVLGKGTRVAIKPEHLRVKTPA